MSDPPAPLRILVVDDSPDAADSLTLLLTVLGHKVRTTYDGPTALHAAGTFRPQVVLLDIGLPRMDGYQVARQLRQQDGLRDALLVAVTGFGQEVDRRRCREAGFAHFLLKPYDPVELGRLLADRQAAVRPQDGNTYEQERQGVVENASNVWPEATRRPPASLGTSRTRGAGYIAPLSPAADEFRKVPKGWFAWHETEAEERLRRYFRQLGFRRVGRTRFFGLSLAQVVPMLAELIRPGRG